MSLTGGAAAGLPTLGRMRRPAFGHAFALRALATTSWAALAACADPATQRRAATPVHSMIMRTAGRAHCAGRFAFVAPDEMREAGRGQSIYRTEVLTVPTPSGGPDAYWEGRRADIAKRALAPPRPVALGRDVRGLWYAGNPVFPEVRTLVAMRPAGAVLLTVSTQAGTEKEVTAEQIIRDIAGAYVAATDRGFCVGDGAILLDPSRFEEARLALRSSEAPDVELVFESQTVREPDASVFAGTDEDRHIVNSRGGTLTVLREHDRVVAGLKGRELWIVADLPKEGSFVRFTWRHPGVSASSTAPYISILAGGPAAQRARLEAIWQAVLTSFYLVPLPPPEAR